jgi:hypothetical protein
MWRRANTPACLHISYRQAGFLRLALYGRIKDKPITTAKLFATILYRVRIEYYYRDDG